MVSGSKGAGQLPATNMSNGRRLGALYRVENVRTAEGRQIFSGLKNGIVAISAVERLKWLLQILKERARQLEICGFESFREAIVHESQGMPGLIALVVFAEQAGQHHRRP
jgi:hypothetical protein